MAYMETITRSWDRAVVAALHCYVAARGAGRPILPTMIAAAEQNGLGAPTAVALSSVFELTEALLGRRLEVAGLADAPLHTDEEAVLLMLEQGGTLAPAQGTAAIPHGLPAVLIWSIRSARQLWSGRDSGVTGQEATPPLRRCPFPDAAMDTLAADERFPVLR